MINKILGMLLVCLISSAIPEVSFAVQVPQGFPHLAGMDIGGNVKAYSDPVYQRGASKFDMYFVQYYPMSPNLQLDIQTMRTALGGVKKLNPNILIGQYTILNEAQDDIRLYVANRDIALKLNAENWWLRKSDGSRVQWTTNYSAWDINISTWARPDSNGMRYPQWIAKRDYDHFFGPVPEIDIWYHDNVSSKSYVVSADWNLDKADELSSSPAIQTAFRNAQVSNWNASKGLAPARLQMGNADNDLSSPEYKAQLHGVFLEGLMGKSWSLETLQGWPAMMARYHAAFTNLLQPKLVVFNTWGAASNYSFFRYAYTSCLLDDGYFSYTDLSKGYSGVPPWFDEYGVKLGKAIDPPQVLPWLGNVFKRAFENGMVVVNSGLKPATVSVPAGYKYFLGTQDPVINNGSPAIAISLPGKSGVVLVKR